MSAPQDDAGLVEVRGKWLHAEGRRADPADRLDAVISRSLLGYERGDVTVLAADASHAR